MSNKLLDFSLFSVPPMSPVIKWNTFHFLTTAYSYLLISSFAFYLRQYEILTILNLDKKIFANTFCRCYCNHCNQKQSGKMLHFNEILDLSWKSELVWLVCLFFVWCSWMFDIESKIYGTFIPWILDMFINIFVQESMINSMLMKFE